jgi:Beta-lactamase enzyme family
MKFRWLRQTAAFKNSIQTPSGEDLTLMIVVSDNTATDLMYDKVGGTEPVNKLMQSWGLNSIRATGTADDWFKALRSAIRPAARVITAAMWPTTTTSLRTWVTLTVRQPVQLAEQGRAEYERGKRLFRPDQPKPTGGTGRSQDHPTASQAAVLASW